MEDSLNLLENICDKGVLQTNLSAIALYIGLYEYMADTIERRVKDFICDDFADDRQKKKQQDKYSQAIKKRVVDEHGNRNVLKASMLWFVDEGAITQEEYQLFLHHKDLRNSYAHEMANHIWNGLTEDDAKDLVGLFDLYTKLDRWWINEIEIPLAGDEVPANYEKDKVKSLAHTTFVMMFQTLYGGKSEEYMNMIREAREDLTFH